MPHETPPHQPRHQHTPSDHTPSDLGAAAGFDAPRGARRAQASTRARTRSASPTGRISTLVFNFGAEIYAWFTNSVAWRTSCARMAAILAASHTTGTILDLGCGPGVSTFALAHDLPESHLVGLDIARRMLNEARRRQRTAGPSAERIRWLLADSARLPLATGSVDACTGHSFLYLVADRRATLREIRRVLKPGGRLVLMEPNARATTVRQTLRVSHDPRHLVSVGLWRPFSWFHGRFTPEALKSTLERAGFIDCQVDETFGGLGVIASARRP